LYGRCAITKDYAIMGYQMREQWEFNSTCTYDAIANMNLLAVNVQCMSKDLVVSGRRYVSYDHKAVNSNVLYSTVLDVLCNLKLFTTHHLRPSLSQTTYISALQ